MRKAREHVPLRTCISCGMKRAKGEMVRLVADEEGFLFQDHLMRRGGRGAYVCNSKECGEGLLKNKRLQRLFRRDQPVILPGAREEGGVLPRKREVIRDQEG